MSSDQDKHDDREDQRRLLKANYPLVERTLNRICTFLSPPLIGFHACLDPTPHGYLIIHRFSACTLCADWQVGSALFSFRARIRVAAVIDNQMTVRSSPRSVDGTSVSAFDSATNRIDVTRAVLTGSL